MNQDKVNAIIEKYKLTPKQEDFCYKYVKCGVASEAYKAVYKAGTKSSALTGGSGMLRHEGCKTLIQYLRSEIRGQNIIELEDIVKKMVSLEEEARQNKKLDVALDTLKAIANIMGFNQKSPQSKDSSTDTNIQINILPPNLNSNNNKNIIKISKGNNKKSLPPTTITVSSNDTSMGDTDINISPQTTSSNMGDTDDDELPFKD